jgi:hypothetical protein
MSYKIISKRELCANQYELVIEAPYVVRNAKAGQFIILRAEENGERIPLTIADVDKEKGELDVINEFTPAQPTEEEMVDYTNELIDNLIAEKGADYQLSQKDMGLLMKGAKMKYPNINGNIVKSVLTTRMS